MDEAKYEIHFDGPIEGVSLGEDNYSTFNYSNRKEQKSRNIASTIWNIPYRRNPFFTGREDLLKQLHENFSTTRMTALTQPQAISGLGGIGKTQIALEYAYRFREEYTSILWVRAATSEAFISDIVSIANLLHLQEKDDEQNQKKIVDSVKRWLEAHDGWLLILDNADNLEILYDFLPTGDRGRILLTTRTRIGGSIADIISVEKMYMQEGMLLLLRRAKILARENSLDQTSQEDQNIARNIVTALDSLPLALDQAGAYIEETKCTLSFYLESYQQREADFLKRRGMNRDHPESVATTWSLSFERILQENPIAADILYVCTFLDPDSIPEEIFTKGSSVLGSSLHRIKQEPLLLNEAISVLLTYSLVRRNPDHTLTIHRLVQAVLKQNMSPKTQLLWGKRVIRALRHAFPKVEYDLWQHCQQYLPHIQICLAFINQKKLNLLEAANLLMDVGKYLRASAQYEQAESFYLHALTIHEKVLGPEHPDTAATLHSLAHIYQDQGKYEHAESFHLRDLAIREKVFGSEDINTTNNLHCLGNLYRVQGKYEQAESFHLRDLVISEKVLGSEHPDTATTLHSLAHLYQEQGKYEHAESFHLRELAIREKVLGSEHPTLAKSLNCLGNLYKEQGKYEHAEAFYLRALTIHEKVLGPEHPDTATTLHGLAHLYKEQGKYEQAESLYLRNLAISEKVLGPEHPKTATTLHSLAHLYQYQKKYEQAESFHLRELAIREKVFGTEHPALAKSLNCLGNLYLAQDKYEQAEAFHLRALTIREKVLGSEHPDTATTLHSLAHLYQEQGKYEQAESFHLRELAIREKIFGTEHPAPAESLHCLGNLYKEQGKYEQAESFYLHALTIREKIFDLEHPLIATTLHRLAHLYKEQSKYEQAESFYLRALTIRKKVLGSEHPNTQAVRKNLDALQQIMRQ